MKAVAADSMRRARSPKRGKPGLVARRLYAAGMAADAVRARAHQVASAFFRYALRYSEDSTEYRGVRAQYMRNSLAAERAALVEVLASAQGALDILDALDDQLAAELKR